MAKPICDFLNKYADNATVRLHMPGHKGKGGSLEKYDITEIAGADSLYCADGIIRASEKTVSSIFSANTFYSTEGSSLSIRAMLYLTALFAKENGKKPRVLAARNVHKSFLSAVCLLDIDVDWLISEKQTSYLSARISPDELETVLSENEELPTAVYVTSPDYLGVLSDISRLAEVCHKHGVLLLVDNAHGAYLNFLGDNLHPIALGADACCDSAHKTLPVLTGGAYLHISHSAPSVFFEMAKEALSLFGSTSPSYLILQSLDSVNDYLCGSYKNELSRLIVRIETLKKKLSEYGYLFFGDEPIKLTLKAKPLGYLGTELADLLREGNIECEFADADFVVLMFSPATAEEEFVRLEEALLGIRKKPPICTTAPIFSKAKKIMSAREAVTSPSECLPIEKCLGRILCAVSLACPPAVPIVVSGELIDERAIECLNYYGVRECRVVKKAK